MRHDQEFFAPANSLGDRLAVWIATGLGVGLVAPAPGTIGGLWGLGLLPAVTSLSQLGAQAAVAVALVIVAIPICGAAARALGGSGDPGAIVLDEIVALPIVFIGVPSPPWATIVAGFLLFRLFDVWKPGLAHEAERLPGGVGIVADDCVAAILACISLHALHGIDRAAELGWLVSQA